jgi:hypothetical protein
MISTERNGSVIDIERGERVSSFKKRGLIAVGVVVTAALAVAIPTVIAGSLASGPGGKPAAEVKTQATFTGNCALNRMTYAQDDTFNFSNTSTSFVPVPGMSRPFAAPFKDTCVHITFSTIYAFAGELYDGSANGVPPRLFVQALVDSTVCTPGPVIWEDGSDDNNNNFDGKASTYQFNCFVFHNPDHPHHTASVQWRSGYAGDTVWLSDPTMTVEWGT